jgi:CO/xanthine dehydrogenase FAD-binding subunit
VEAAATIGAAQIQNRGTIGGNVVNASPAGDTLPVLLACGAEMVLGSADGERIVRPMSSGAPIGRRRGRDDELLLRVRIPLVRDRQVRFQKIGTRRAQAISKVVMALAWRATNGGDPWTDVRAGTRLHRGHDGSSAGSRKACSRAPGRLVRRGRGCRRARR